MAENIYESSSTLTDPIRNKEDIKKFLSELKQGRHADRDYMIGLCGIYTGMKINELLETKVGDWHRWIDNKGWIEYIPLKYDHRRYDPVEGRIKGSYKIRKFKLSEKAFLSIYKYIEGRDDYEWMFPAKYEGSTSAVAYGTVFRIIKSAAKRAGIKGNIGTNSLRKTFGYQLYTNAPDNKKQEALVKIMKCFEHSDSGTTLRYIGVMQDDIDEMTSELDYDLDF